MYGFVYVDIPVCMSGQVFYIDYGTIAEVQVRQTCFLHHDFARLPAQAIRARLANIMPVQQNTMWPREATRCMMRLIMEKDLIALISAIDYEVHYQHTTLH